MSWFKGSDPRQPSLRGDLADVHRALNKLFKNGNDRVVGPAATKLIGLVKRLGTRAGVAVHDRLHPEHDSRNRPDDFTDV